MVIAVRYCNRLLEMKIGGTTFDEDIHEKSNMINTVWVQNAENSDSNNFKQIFDKIKKAKTQTPHGMHFSMCIVMASSWSNFCRHRGHSFWRMSADSFFSSPSLFADALSSTSIPGSGTTSPPLNISSTSRLLRPVGPHAWRKAACEP